MFIELFNNDYQSLNQCYVIMIYSTLTTPISCLTCGMANISLPAVCMLLTGHDISLL